MRDTAEAGGGDGRLNGFRAMRCVIGWGFHFVFCRCLLKSYIPIAEVREKYRYIELSGYIYLYFSLIILYLV